MVINLCSPNNSINNNSQAPNQFSLREQLCAIQNHHLQQQQQTSNPAFNSQPPSSSLTALDSTQVPFNQYSSSASSQASPSSASLLLAAQLLFGSGQTENTPPHLVSSLNSSLLSPQQLMDTSAAHQLQNTSSTNSADAGSPSSSHSNSNDLNGDGEGAEGVWSADIDQAFHEALQIYPPCGRRKIILSEEGKMYGRNELIARYIKIRCGKTRTRKQVSSHIQVLARKKNREVQSKLKTQEIKSESMPPHASTFGSPKSADSLSAIVGSQISPSTTLTAPLFSSNGLSGLTPIKMEPKQTVDSSLAATPTITSSNPQQPPQLATTAALQWPYNMVPNVFNNNFYGNVAAGINNDENLYANFAAALSAQQQINQQFGSTAQSNPNAAANQLLSLGGLPALNKILPNLPFPTSATNGLFQAQQNGSENAGPHTISSSKLTLCGFNAYVEMPERIDILKIPSVVDEPLEAIHFDSIKSKFPELLEELFREGPTDAFFLVKCWANLSFDIDSVGSDESSVLYATDSFYESEHNFDISISSKVCSFGKQAVEKVEVYSANEDERNGAQSSSSNAPFRYKLEKSPMCEYMVAFIRELKKLENSEMNCVLENFTILQIVKNKQTDETLMVIAFNFEVSPEPESNCRVFKLI